MFIQVYGLVVTIGNMCCLLLRYLLLSVKTPDAQALSYSLKAADLLMGVYLCTLAAVGFTHKDSFTSITSSFTKSPLCVFLSLVNFLSFECSLLMLTVLSVVRFKCISKVVGLKRMKKTISISAGLSWTGAAVFGVSYLGLISLADLKMRNDICIVFVSFHKHEFQLLFMEYVFQTIFIVFNLFCLFILFFSSIGLFQVVVKSSQSIRMLGETVSGQTSNTKIMKIRYHLVVLVVCHSICWIPILVVCMLTLFDLDVHQQVLQWLVVLVMPLGALLNPVLHNFHLFKDGWQKVMCKKEIS